MSDLENLVDTLHRAMLLALALRASQALSGIAHLPLPDDADARSVRLFRNRIEHGDEDIRDGKAGKGIPVATMLPDMTGIEIAHFRLEYQDLARWLRMIYEFLRAAIAQLPSQNVGS